jgi:hypothetical protein
VRSSSLSIAHFFFLPRVLAHRRALSFRFSTHTYPRPPPFSRAGLDLPYSSGEGKTLPFFLAPPSSLCFSCRRFLHFAVTLRTRLEINTATGFRGWGGGGGGGGGGWVPPRKKLRNQRRGLGVRERCRRKR